MKWPDQETRSAPNERKYRYLIMPTAFCKNSSHSVFTEKRRQKLRAELSTGGFGTMKTVCSGRASRSGNEKSEFRMNNLESFSTKCGKLSVDGQPRGC